MEAAGIEPARHSDRVITGSGYASRLMAVCKVEGCECDAVEAMGRWARLCMVHRDEARQAARGAAVPGSVTSESLARCARRIAPLAARLEKAASRRSVARAELKTALDEWNSALRQLQAIAQ